MSQTLSKYCLNVSVVGSHPVRLSGCPSATPMTVAARAESVD